MFCALIIFVHQTMIKALPISTRRESFFEKVGNYMRVGYLLHGMAVFNAFACGLTLQYAWEQVTSTRPVAFIFTLWLSSFFFMIVLLSQLDALSRYQNFKQVRDQLFQYGYQKRIVYPLAKSSCQRVAALMAGKQLRLHDQIKEQYRMMGYRWHHLLPDFVSTTPLFLFHPLFWKTTFLVKRYKSRYF